MDTTPSDSRANSAVEASTEKAHPESDQDELKASSRYSSNWQSSVVSDARTSIDEESDESSSHLSSESNDVTQQDDQALDTADSSNNDYER